MSLDVLNNCKTKIEWKLESKYTELEGGGWAVACILSSSLHTANHRRSPVSMLPVHPKWLGGSCISLLSRVHLLFFIELK